jgi:hypothetical protein
MIIGFSKYVLLFPWWRIHCTRCSLHCKHAYLKLVLFYLGPLLPFHPLHQLQRNHSITLLLHLTLFRLHILMQMWRLTYLTARHPLYISLCHSLPTLRLSQNHNSFAPNGKVHSKLSSLREQREREKIICCHCGDLGHLSSACRNSIVYFMYDKVGHRSWQCQSAQPIDISRPHLSLKLIEDQALPKWYKQETSRNPSIQPCDSTFYESRFDFIQYHLHKLFPLNGWQWIARFIDNSSYLIDPPNDDQCHRALAKSHLILGDIIFPLALFDTSKFDKDRDLVLVWIQVLDLPYYIWQDFEFHRIADEIWDILLDVNPKSAHHIGFILLRFRIGVPTLESVLSCRNIFFSQCERSCSNLPVIIWTRNHYFLYLFWSLVSTSDHIHLET